MKKTLTSRVKRLEDIVETNLTKTSTTEHFRRQRAEKKLEGVDKRMLREGYMPGRDFKAVERVRSGVTKWLMEIEEKTLSYEKERKEAEVLEAYRRAKGDLGSYPLRRKLDLFGLRTFFFLFGFDRMKSEWKHVWKTLEFE